MKWRSFSMTDVGLSREHNEDYMLVDDELGVAIVCDGMGGHQAGEIASQMAADLVMAGVKVHRDRLEHLCRLNDYTSRNEMTTMLSNIMSDASEQIYRKAIEIHGEPGMGTTLVLLIHCGAHMLVAHVGDSRVYLVRHGECHRLTEDHSYLSEMVRQGRMSKEEALLSPYANVITRAIGVKPRVEVDVLVLDVSPADKYVLCTDGIHHVEEEDEWAKERMRDTSIDTCPRALITYANAQGGHDNSTVIAVELFSSPFEEQAKTPVAGEINLRMDTLKQIKLFSYLSYAEAIQVLSRCTISTFEPGGTVIEAGDFDEQLYIVLKGDFEVRVGDVLVETCRFGDHFGEMALLRSEGRTADVIAVSHGELLSMNKIDFFNLIRAEPTLATKILWQLMLTFDKRLRATNAILSKTA